MNIHEKFKKGYEAKEVEQNTYQKWEESGYFNPDNCLKDGITQKDAPHYSVVLPPPNVTGILHTGHALMLTIEDIAIRYHRMKGYRTLWIPGTDHASIATESKVVKLLSKKKIRKHDIGREKFLEHVKEFTDSSQDTIVDQIKRMGSSLDWSREAFTLDEQRQNAVYTAFKNMFDLGLIYQGDRIVNWDPKGQTTISDDEIVRQEDTTKFYYFKYGPFTIGTARPETKFGDKYVVMHPSDDRYKEYKHGQKITLEWINGPIEATIIKDEASNPEFGTGVMTITPWHSQVDFEIAERHNLDKEQIIDKYGKLLPIAGEFAGEKITEARDKIVAKLDKKGLLVKIEDNYVHQKATAERTGGIIEPQIMKQWWISVTKEFTWEYDTIPGIEKGSKVTLKQVMQHVVRDNHISILPERFEKHYFHWIDNLRDWCISRQLWYGHRIPVWYKDDQIRVSQKSPGDGWIQDEDTLDTWFSSGLWTFSTLGWPENTKDLKNYHPTSLLETGYDIIFFWVARMILMTTANIGQIPFKTVYFHGLVRDEQGRKISKSLGNNIDPIELIDKYGTDALRMAMVVSVGPGNDVSLGESKIKAYKKFSNKIWNASRFVLENLDENLDLTLTEDTLTEEHKTYLKDLNNLIAEVNDDMEKYNYYLASEKLYHYFWHTFADVIIEKSKEDLKDGSKKHSTNIILHHILKTTLTLLHPFMPYITEEIWSHLPDTDQLLLVSPWPES